MKILIAYYSRNNTTHELAQYLLEKLSEKGQQAETVRIIDLKNRNGIFGFIRGGWDAVKQKQTSIRCEVSDLCSYDLVLLGSPIWAEKITPAIRTFITQNKENMKNVAFFSSAGGDKFHKFFDDMENLVGKHPKGSIGIQRKLWREQKSMCQAHLDQFITTVLS